MCYLIAKKTNKPGCIALQIKPGEETIKYKKDLVVI